jgi:hypothetical protein
MLLAKPALGEVMDKELPETWFSILNARLQLPEAALGSRRSHLLRAVSRDKFGLCVGG